MKKRFLSTCLILMCFMLISPHAFAKVGTVVFALGSVEKLTLQGKLVRLKKGSSVDNGDTLISGKKGQLMLRMLDDSKVTIRPNTRFVISNYQYKGLVASDKSEYELIKGGFRTLTGKMGKRNKGSFKTKSPVGTLGIRGTDFSASYCTQACGDKSGLYVSVMSGGVSVSNRKGTLNVKPGQNGYVRSLSSSPNLVESLPPALQTSKDPSQQGSMSHEEEMVAIAIKVSDGDMRAVVKEMADNGMSTETIIQGAGKAGVEPADVLAPLLDSSSNKQQILEDSIRALPDRAGDILTMSVATNRVSAEQAQTLATQAGVDSNVTKAAVTLGKLLAPPVDASSDTGQGGSTDGSSAQGGGSLSTESVPVENTNQSVPPELIPQGGTGGGEPASPS